MASVYDVTRWDMIYEGYRNDGMGGWSSENLICIRVPESVA